MTRYQAPIKWSKPENGNLKINCDASYNTSNSTGKAIFVCRNHKGKIINAAAKSLNCSSAEVVDALRIACQYVTNHDLKNVVVESDAKNCVEAIQVSLDQGVDNTKWELSAIMQDIVNNLGTALKYRYTRFKHINREASNLAHYFSKNSFLDN